MVTPPALSVGLVAGSLTGPEVSGQLLDADGAPVTAETVTVETSLDGRFWMEGPTAVTDQSGDFTFDVDARSGDLQVRVWFAGTPEYPAAVSPEITVEQTHIIAGLVRPQP
jgi:hypothetical protein